MPNDPRTDQQLIAAINSGDLPAFDSLYHRHRDWVLRLAWRFTRHEQDALDVMQATFAYLAGKFPGFRLTAAMTSFLYPVVRNLSTAARKRTLRYYEPHEIDPPAPPIDPVSELGLVLANLSAGHREVVLMRFVDDFSLQEIADTLRIPLGTVKSRLHNALQLLRNDARIKEFFLP